MNLSEFSRRVYRFFKIPESALCSILQNAIDHKLKNTGLFLILCGSQVGFMESEVLGYKSPLFGRRTAQIELDGLDYFDAAKMLPGFSKEEKLILYSCFGGTPHYLAQIDEEETVEENIKRLYFDLSGYLYNEPLMLLRQELREPALYNSIVTAIALGANRVNEIALRLRMEPNHISRYLDTLLNLHIIKRSVLLEKYRRKAESHSIWLRITAIFSGIVLYFCLDRKLKAGMVRVQLKMEHPKLLLFTIEDLL